MTNENRVSGLTLKILAIISMFVDHVTYVLIPPLLNGGFSDFISGYKVIAGPFAGLDLEAVYQIGRGFGRGFGRRRARGDRDVKVFAVST